ncbi:RsmD family RNA methyltransferase [Aeriscardovia aeriphila]|uniref:DNA methyltransferase n=1 Tax=Aeriscardovia aeriphila TaxID=218139 RepID=A0A261FD17_9BIFI|nr:RsmD family RNA methyltransferase [Aeriscardovia aeriphila]NYI26241.1 16S rRNA (guanine966-N2)-methyltransferase [Aeriscardovia aeriphila]OZG56786.1 DNA methyltransferase [Aeriscardovia aeriphila]
MRLISGIFKGFEVKAPHAGTRPTTDRAKEGIFSHLESENMLDGVAVLDLFAGTGTLGFEALSRGACSLVLVDNSSQAYALLNDALRRMRKLGAWDSSHMQASVRRMNAQNFVAYLASPRIDSPQKSLSTLPSGELPSQEASELSEKQEQWDLVFLDPPYAFSDEAFNQLMADLAQTGRLSSVCEIVAERSSRTAIPMPPDGWSIEQSKKYGETVIYYIVRAESL